MLQSKTQTSLIFLLQPSPLGHAPPLGEHPEQTSHSSQHPAGEARLQTRQPTLPQEGASVELYNLGN